MQLNTGIGSQHGMQAHAPDLVEGVIQAGSLLLDTSSKLRYSEAFKKTLVRQSIFTGTVEFC